VAPGPTRSRRCYADLKRDADIRAEPNTQWQVGAVNLSVAQCASANKVDPASAGIGELSAQAQTDAAIGTRVECDTRLQLEDRPAAQPQRHVVDERTSISAKQEGDGSGQGKAAVTAHVQLHTCPRVEKGVSDSASPTGLVGVCTDIANGQGDGGAHAGYKRRRW
jgi:hypothetical protein